jgi:hypothetical protein
MTPPQLTASVRGASPIEVDKGVVLLVGLLFALLPLAIAGLSSPRHGVLFLIGGLLGAALYHASFGFTGGWRRMVVERRGRAMRAQMLMVAVAAVAFIPLLAAGEAFGQPLIGALAPLGVSVVVGAAMFGFGMQLGGGCGSGTLFTVGGGSARMLVTLVFFCIGALIGSAHLPWWLALPSFGTVDLGRMFGPGAAIALTLAFLGAVAGLTALIERRAHGSLESVAPAPRDGLARLIHGPWPLVGAGLVLAALNLATLLIAGHPWSVTFAFGLWAAKAAQAVGVAVGTWPFWTAPGAARALEASVLLDVTSVMNFGIILGAALAAGLAGKFAPKAALPLGSLLAAVLGGLLMGYGARLSFGCNIGALFSGIASGSLHGWVWFAMAFLGSLAGIRARRWFGME